MKNGYDQFFKNAQGVASKQTQSKKPAAKNNQSRFSFQNEEAKKSIESGYLKKQTLPKDSKKMAEELRLRVQAQNQLQFKKKRRKKISWKMASVSFLGLLITAGVVWQFEKVESIIKKVEFSLLGSVYAEEKTGKEKDSKDKNAKASEANAKDVAATGKDAKNEEKEVAKKDFTEDDINHFSKLNDRKRELDTREEELNKVEQELALQKTELEKKMKELENTRQNISKVLEERVQVDDKKVENLVQLYSTMKPQQAAKAFEEMDEGLAIEILGRMKKKNAAEIMNLVKAEKVKVFSEKYAGYKRN